jgi:hypothetical protein
MQKTLLELTQDVLSSIDGDEVDSIGDTIESRQVAKIIERMYQQIVSGNDLPEDFRLFQFIGTSDTTPILLTRPDDIDEVLWFKYNKVLVGETDPNIQEVIYLDPSEYYDYMTNFKTSSSNVESCSLVQDEGSTITLYYENDRPPKYWTSFDDATVVCDAYLLALEANLQTSKSVGYGRYLKTFTQADSFVPPINDQEFSLLLNESIACAWAELKQAQNAKAEKQARFGWVSSQRRKSNLPHKTSMINSTPNYGRR